MQYKHAVFSEQNRFYICLTGREAGLGLLLSGIVLALAAIGTVLGFQFQRIRELITDGR